MKKQDFFFSFFFVSLWQRIVDDMVEQWAAQAVIALIKK